MCWNSLKYLITTSSDNWFMTASPYCWYIHIHFAALVWARHRGIHHWQTCLCIVVAPFSLTAGGQLQLEPIGGQILFTSSYPTGQTAHCSFSWVYPLRKSVENMLKAWIKRQQGGFRLYKSLLLCHLFCRGFLFVGSKESSAACLPVMQCPHTLGGGAAHGELCSCAPAQQNQSVLKVVLPDPLGRELC